MWIIPVIEVTLVICGVISTTGTICAVWIAHQEHTLLGLSGVNGIKRKLSIAHIIRQTCRFVASMATLIGGIHLVILSSGDPHAPLIAKITLMIDAVALTGTVMVDIWTHRRVTR